MNTQSDTGDFFPAEADQAVAAAEPGPAGQAPVSYAAWARVAVDQPVAEIYSYGIPEALAPDIQDGSLVLVSFSGRRARGCVLSVEKTPPEGVVPGRIKPVLEVLSPGYRVDGPLISLALWMAEYYMCSPGEAIGCVSFLGLNDIGGKSVVRFQLAEMDRTQEQILRLTAKQQAVLDHLREAGAQSAEELRVAVGASADTLKRLVGRGILTAEEHDVDRGDDYGDMPAPDRALALAPAQQLAFERIRSTLAAREPRTFLLHGVTGSGKTEVYLQSIDEALRLGGAAIVLVPEISLTPQTVSRFRSRFGELVGVYHSKLTLGQKYDLWRRVKSGQCRIMVGARSAVFTPFSNLKVIVVDEEHETTYKQDSVPRYHARDVAIMRAQGDRAVVVLGSATPSIETYYKAQTGKFELLHLADRVDHRPMPEVRIVDMTQEAKENRNPGLFSEPLQVAMQEALGRGEQVLLFLNRRGYFNFAICLSCNTAVRCRHCDFALTHHKPRNILMCHYCSREYHLPKKCADCGATDLSLIGVGTQRVEEALTGDFPGARVIRLDLDTTRKRNAYLEAWRRIEANQIDIILGTQMIAKGIHLEGVTVVGVPLADVSLFQPDFRSAERAFAVLTQVAGRAGRGDKAGTVYIQTYVPHHYAIGFARTHDYRGFYDKELRVRQVLRFPPHYRLTSVLATGTDEGQVQEKIKDFAAILRTLGYRLNDAVMVLGPAPAPVARIKDQWRWRLLIRGQEPAVMRRVLKEALVRYREIPGFSRVQLHVDVDPQDLL